MPYFDLARVEYHRQLDMLRAEPGDRQFVMRAMTVEYHAPARFDDPIEVDVRISRIGTSSVHLRVRGLPRGRDARGDRDADAGARRSRRAQAVPDAGLVAERSGPFEGDDVEARVPRRLKRTPAGGDSSRERCRLDDATPAGGKPGQGYSPSRPAPTSTTRETFFADAGSRSRVMHATRAEYDLPLGDRACRLLVRSGEAILIVEGEDRRLKHVGRS